MIPPRILISFASQDRSIANYVRQHLVRAVRGVEFVLADEIPAGTTWQRELERRFSTCAGVVALLSEHSAGAKWQSRELIAAEKAERTVVPIRIDDIDVPFGVLDAQCPLIARDDDEFFEKVLNEVRTALGSVIVEALRPDPWEASLAQFSDGVDKSLESWLVQIGADEQLGALSAKLLERVVAQCIDGNARTDYRVHLRHSARVLGFVETLGGCRPDDHGGGATRFCLSTPKERFLACFGVLFHNLCLLPRLLPEGWESDNSSFRERAQRFGDRIARLQGWMSSGFSPQEKRLVEIAFLLSREMYRDSPYWTRAKGKTDDSEDVAEHEWSRLARVLRRADAMDVGHRFLADLVTASFKRMNYERGLDTYFARTFERSALLMMSEEPELVGTRLLIRWRKPHRGGSRLCRSLRRAVVRAQELITADLQRVLDRIHHPSDRALSNLSIRVERMDSEDEWTDEEVAHLSWALFPTAITMADSDTESVEAVAQLTPKLVQYIYGAALGAASDELRPDEGFIERETDALLNQFPALRPNSPDLRTTCTAARAALQGCRASEYPRVVETHMSEVLSELEKREWGAVETEARVFLVYGASRPIAKYLASVAQTNYHDGKTTTVYPILCTRHFDAEDDDSTLHRPIAPQDQTSRMHSMLESALRSLDLPAAAIDWRAVIDAQRIPTVAHEERMRGSHVELLFGARAFATDTYHEERTPIAVTIYGCHMLTAACEFLDIPARVVTWEDRLKHRLDEYRPATTGFCFSYGFARGPSAENERVPIEILGGITTEERAYTPEAVVEMFEGGPKEKGPQRMLPGRESRQDDAGNSGQRASGDDD